MTSMRAIPYRVKYLLRGRLLDPSDMPGAFDVGGKRPVRITLSGDVRGEGDARTWVNLCDAETVIAPRQHALEELAALADCTPPPGAMPLAPDYVRSLLDNDGRIRAGSVLPIRFLSADVQRLVAGAERFLFECTFRLVTVARWRLAIPGPHQPLIAEAHSWKPGAEWQVLPVEIPRPQWVTASGSLGERWRSEIERLMRAGPEPVAQELYREASVQRYENRRSALVMAVAAAEAGLITAAEALGVPLSRGGAPNFAQLLQLALPKLATRRPIRGRKLLPPPKVIDDLTRARDLRNKIIHRGSLVPTVGDVDRALEATRNLLLFVDFYTGHGWALATADATLLAAAARSIGLTDAGDLIRATWPDPKTISPFVR